MRPRVRRFALGSVLLAVLLGILAAGSAGFSAQTVPAAAPQAAAEPAKTAEVRPAPLAPKTQVGLYVFLVCLWLALAFLLYFLRLRVREADRVFRTGLYGKPDGHEGPLKL
jgi:hypothetical protein